MGAGNTTFLYYNTGRYPTRGVSLEYVVGKFMMAWWHGPLARYVKLRVAHAPGMPGMFSPPPRVSDPDIHHGTCVTHVPWCMPASLISGFLWSRWRVNVPGIPSACTTHYFTYLVRGPWKRFPHYWSFARGEARWIFPHKGPIMRSFYTCCLCCWPVRTSSQRLPLIWAAVTLMWMHEA